MARALTGISIDYLKELREPSIAVSFVPAHKLFIETERFVTFKIVERFRLLTKQIFPIVSKSAPIFARGEIASQNEYLARAPCHYRQTKSGA